MAWNVGASAHTPGHHSSPLFIPPPVGAVSGGEPLGFHDPRQSQQQGMPSTSPYHPSQSFPGHTPAPSGFGGWPNSSWASSSDAPPSVQRAPTAPPQAAPEGYSGLGWQVPQNTPQVTNLYGTPSQYGRTASSSESQTSGVLAGTPRTYDPQHADHSPWRNTDVSSPDPWAAGGRTSDNWGADQAQGESTGGWGQGGWGDAGDTSWGNTTGAGWVPSSTSNSSPLPPPAPPPGWEMSGLNRSISQEKPRSKRKHKSRARASSDPAWVSVDPPTPPNPSDPQYNQYGSFSPSPYAAPGFNTSSVTAGSSSPLWPGYPPESNYNEMNVAKRPRDWREEYSVRGGISFRVPLSPSRSDIRDISDPVKRMINPMLAYHSHPSVVWNFPGDPFLIGDISFPYLKRQHNDLDYAQLASTPGAPVLRLFHPRYPWYIDVRSSHENGVTVGDVLMQVHVDLLTAITPRHFYNEDLGPRERAKLGEAYQKRTSRTSDPSAASRGVLRIDFLGMEGLDRFVGLTRTRNGMWEIKLKKSSA